MYWIAHLEGGPRRVNHAAAAVGDRIYSFGGYSTGENFNKPKPMDIHVLNTGNLRWTQLGSKSAVEEVYNSTVPFQRYGHSAVAYQHNIYIWGGRNDESACNRVYCFNTDTRQWSRPEVTGVVPVARDGHSACLINHCMYVFGGFEEEIDMYSNDVFYLDLRTMEWHYVVTSGVIPKHRDFHSATAIGSRMYVFGGRGDLNGPYVHQREEYCSDIIYLDTDTKRWHKPVTTGNVPIGRRSHSAFSCAGFLYIFGGYNGITGEHYNDLYQFNPITNEWKLVNCLGKAPRRRRRQSCLVVNERVFLFGGTSPLEVLPDSGDHNSLQGLLAHSTPEPPSTDSEDDEDNANNHNLNMPDQHNVNQEHQNPQVHQNVMENGNQVDGENESDTIEEYEESSDSDEDDTDAESEDSDGHDDDSNYSDDLWADYEENHDAMNPNEMDFNPIPWVFVNDGDGDTEHDAKLMDLNDLHVLDFYGKCITGAHQTILPIDLDGFAEVPQGRGRQGRTRFQKDRRGKFDGRQFHDVNAESMSQEPNGEEALTCMSSNVSVKGRF